MSIPNNMTKEMCKDLERFLIKLSYPITGNLSNNIKKHLENVFSDDFNIAESTMISYATNILINSFIAYQLYKTHNKPVSEAMATGGIVAFVTFAESAIRWGISEYKKPYPEPKPIFYPGSLAGKIISCPIKYIINLYERVKRKTKYQRKKF